MASGTDKARALSLRALVVFCALLSLCVSDNVGPRLLPLPHGPGLAPTPAPFDPGQAAAPGPSHGRTEGRRVEMVSAPQSRAGAERQTTQSAALAPKFELAAAPAPRSLRRELYPPSGQNSAPFSHPKGRAPPRLV
jgi:hypothetical protein